MEIYNTLFKILNPEALILTANERLIVFLQKAYAIHQQRQGGKMWPTPLILTLSRWLEITWEKQLIQTRVAPYRLLTRTQEYVIWQTIINQSSCYFLDSYNTAKTAQKAWQLMQQWQLDYQSASFNQASDTQSWQTWAKSFVEFLKIQNCIDTGSATSILIDLFRKKILKSPSQIILVGFAEINPHYKKLFQTLEKAGSHITLFSPACPKPTLQRLVQPTQAIELQTMAQWAYRCWQTGEETIGCAIPNLMDIRSQVVYTFTDVFTTLAKQTRSPLPFNIASGNSMREFPLIQIALTILGLKNNNPFNLLSKLIRSPYLRYSQQEQSQRVQLDIHLRQHYENTVSLEQLAQASKHQHCPQLSLLIEKLVLLLNENDNNKQQFPSEWAQYFAKKLQILGWPGQRTLISSEFQLIERWSELLSEFAHFDFILGKVTRATALKQIYPLVTQTLFQAKVIHEPRIHILGLLDTTDICFDALWIMGLDDKTWPTSAQPNPFIPYALQRQHQLPHASNERELYFASLLTQRLLSSAPTIIISHPLKTLDQSLRPSLLISTIKPIEISHLKLPHYQPIIEKVRVTQAWEYYTDDQGPTLGSHELSLGGSHLLKSQAACPFQAFARFRLHARSHPSPQSGLNARERGTLIHQVLEQFWNALGETTLLKQSPEALTKLIDQAITLCMHLFTKKKPFLFKTHFMMIERERLQQCLKNIIDLEKKRPPVIQSLHEKKQDYMIGKLSLHLRVDRIDELADGSQFIIDYKTGLATPLDYLEERLDDPQLPLYCLAYSKTVLGFAILHIRSHHIELRGITEKESGIPTLIPLSKLKAPLSFCNWSMLLNHWKTLLEKLATEFQEGFAYVDPKRGLTTCRQCDLQLFCRVNHHVTPS